MSRILIVEPHADIRSLLGLVVDRIGHEAVIPGSTHPDVEAIDAAVIEPGDGSAFAIAEALGRQGRPVVFVSIFPPDDRVLALAPVAYLVKPFALCDLERALESALARVRGV
ncbi:MAG: hypothetical protein WCH31_03190 [Actinomycetes bacterium]